MPLVSKEQEARQALNLPGSIGYQAPKSAINKAHEKAFPWAIKPVAYNDNERLGVPKRSLLPSDNAVSWCMPRSCN